MSAWIKWPKVVWEPMIIVERGEPRTVYRSREVTDADRERRANVTRQLNVVDVEELATP